MKITQKFSTVIVATVCLAGGAVMLGASLTGCGSDPSADKAAEQQKSEEVQEEDPATLNAKLYRAVSDGKAEEVKALLEKGADAKTADEKGEPILTTAVLNGDSAIATLLLDHGANPNHVSPPRLPYLVWALGNGRVELATVLLNHGADPNAVAEDESPMHNAARYGRVEVLRLMLDHGANPNLVYDDQKATPLHIAAWYGQKEAAALLLERGADANAKDAAGQSPLGYAQSPALGVDEAAAATVAELLKSRGGK